jgi:hypothetical protein
MTPQQLKAMKLALEALELINIEFVCRNGSHHKKEDRHEWDEDCPITNRWRKAITAIKEVLAEHAMRETQRLGQEIEQEPPQRTWVGLTKENLMQFAEAQYGWDDLIVAVETKLKEKNT